MWRKSSDAASQARRNNATPTTAVPAATTIPTPATSTTATRRSTTTSITSPVPTRTGVIGIPGTGAATVLSGGWGSNVAVHQPHEKYKKQSGRTMVEKNREIKQRR